MSERNQPVAHRTRSRFSTYQTSKTLADCVVDLCPRIAAPYAAKSRPTTCTGKSNPKSSKRYTNKAKSKLRQTSYKGKNKREIKKHVTSQSDARFNHTNQEQFSKSQSRFAAFNVPDDFETLEMETLSFNDFLLNALKNTETSNTESAQTLRKTKKTGEKMKGFDSRMITESLIAKKSRYDSDDHVDYNHIDHGDKHDDNNDNNNILIVGPPYAKKDIESCVITESLIAKRLRNYDNHKDDHHDYGDHDHKDIDNHHDVTAGRPYTKKNIGSYVITESFISKKLSYDSDDHGDDNDIDQDDDKNNNVIIGPQNAKKDIENCMFTESLIAKRLRNAHSEDDYNNDDHFSNGKDDHDYNSNDDVIAGPLNAMRWKFDENDWTHKFLKQKAHLDDESPESDIGNNLPDLEENDADQLFNSRIVKMLSAELNELYQNRMQMKESSENIRSTEQRHPQQNKSPMETSDCLPSTSNSQWTWSGSCPAQRTNVIQSKNSDSPAREETPECTYNSEDEMPFAKTFDPYLELFILSKCLHRMNRDEHQQMEFGGSRKCIETDIFAAGKLVIRPFACETRLSHIFDIWVFCIIKGGVSLKLHKLQHYLNTGDFFYIPPCNTFTIENNTDENAELVFTWLKPQPA